MPKEWYVNFRGGEEESALNNILLVCKALCDSSGPCGSYSKRFCFAGGTHRNRRTIGPRLMDAVYRDNRRTLGQPPIGSGRCHEQKYFHFGRMVRARSRALRAVLTAFRKICSA